MILESRYIVPRLALSNLSRVAARARNTCFDNFKVRGNSEREKTLAFLAEEPRVSASRLDIRS